VSRSIGPPSHGGNPTRPELRCRSAIAQTQGGLFGATERPPCGALRSAYRAPRCDRGSVPVETALEGVSAGQRWKLGVPLAVEANGRDPIAAVEGGRDVDTLAGPGLRDRGPRGNDSRSSAERSVKRGTTCSFHWLNDSTCADDVQRGEGMSRNANSRRRSHASFEQRRRRPSHPAGGLWPSAVKLAGTARSVGFNCSSE